MKTIQDLDQIRAKTLPKIDLSDDSVKARVVVGMGTCGISAGATPVLNKIVEEVERLGLKDVIVTQTGCIGVCRLEPMVEIYKPGEQKVTYVLMNAEKAAKVVEEHLAGGKVVTEYTIGAAF